MRTILYIIDTLETGGAEKSLLEITSRFVDSQPIFIQLFKGDGLQNEFKKRGIEVIPMNFDVSYKFKRLAQQILPLIIKYQPDLIHSTLFRSDMVARHLKNMTGLPLINSFVNNSYGTRRYEEIDLYNKLKIYSIQLWDRFTAKKVDLFISNSETIKVSNARALNYPLGKIKVIYRGRSKAHFNSEIDIKSLEELKEVLNIKDKKVLLNVSRLLDRKGQLDLIRAFEIFKRNNLDSILLIAGEGPYRRVLEKEIRNLNLSKDVYLLGNRNDVPLLLNIADVFVFPSYYEGLPGALIEAMFAKIPIVASDISENVECLVNKGSFIFKKGDIEDLVLQLQKRFSTSELDINTMTNKNLNKAEKNFEIQNVVRQYEKVYQNLISQL